MSEINLQNYEAWFLDHLEGNLDEAQQALLLEFLETNPELKASLEAYDAELCLLPGDAEISTYHIDKDSFKVPVAGNFDELLISYLEGDLDKAGEAKTEKLIALNPSVAKDFELIKKTKLEPDYAIIFQDKKKLKKGQGKVIRMYWYGAAAAAACTALLVLKFGISPYPVNGPTVVDVQKDTTETSMSPGIEAVSPEIINEGLADTKNPALKKSAIIKPAPIQNVFQEETELQIAKQEILLPEAYELTSVTEPEKPSVNGLEILPSENHAIANGFDEDFALAADNVQEEFLSPKDLMAKKIKAILGEDNVEGLKGFKDFADAGIEKATGKKIRISRNEDGVVSNFSIGRFFEFSRSQKEED
jgi:hypothetical protein